LTQIASKLANEQLISSGWYQPFDQFLQDSFGAEIRTG
jgi:hypothetical protein